MGERRGTRGLELWCKRMTEGYPGVKVENMTTSWRDGLAFCAIIHHFRPDLIDFTSLNKNDIYSNNNLAFRIAEDHLGIPALLEPEDMVEYAVPDRLSILTYLSQFYQVFAVNSNSPTKVPSKRPPPADLQRHMATATGSSTPKKAALGVLGARREPCTKCALPVFIAERLNVGKALYHRTCFRCARCNSQLTLANYYETENGEFCCETCPDEEKATTSHETNILSRSLSDEEKSASMKDSDPYSGNFENALDDPSDGSLKRNFTLDRMLGTQFVKARTDFMTTQMATSSTDSETESEDKPPDLPVTQIPQLVQEHSENIDVFSNNLLPSLSDNISVNSGQCTPDQEHSESQDSVTKDSISPSIRSRMKLFETGVEDRVKSDVNIETVKISECDVEVPQLKTPESVCEKTEQSSSDITEEDCSIHPDQKIVEEEVSLKDSPNSQLEESKYISANDSIFSDSPKLDETNEVILVSSDTSPEPMYSSPINSQDDTAVPEKTNVIIISDSEDSSSQPDIAPSDDSNNLTENMERPAAVVEYPDDMNPFGDDEETDEAGEEHSGTVNVDPKITESVPNTSLNPFGDTDEEEEEESPVVENKPVPAPRLIVPPKSLNPFGSDDEEENEETSSSLPPQPALRKLKAPKISLTPWADDSPVQANNSFSTPPKSYSDTISLTGSGRKKKPAPKPPISSIFPEVNDSPFSSLNSSPSQSLCHIPNAPSRSRKMRRAPPPPASTPRSKLFQTSEEPACSPIDAKTIATELKPLQFKTGSVENLKTDQNEMNVNRKDSNPISEGPSSLPNKSTYGKWKRRKGQAPARPIPQKRTIKMMPLNDIKHELEIIEIQQQGLEKQGVTLEKIIRERSETPGTNADDTLAPEIEDMILQLFELVNEKNELFRKQTELMYLRRQYRLEEEHAEIEYQIRCLMLQPDANKTDSDKTQEEELLNRMIEIVERRNEIVDCLEMERRREAEEDSSIRNQLNLYSMRREGEHSLSIKSQKKDKHKHKKDKDKKIKKNKGDTDESLKSTPKDKKKKKMLGLF